MANRPNYEEQEVKVNGFVRSVRKQKRFAFAHITDGTTVQSLQAILKPEQASGLSTGTAIEISGVWKKSPAKGQSHELEATNIKIIGEVDPQTYPIQKKYHTPEFLRSVPHLRFRTPFNSLLTRFRSEVSFVISNFFRHRRECGPFYQIQPPLITSSDCEGAGEVFTLAPKEKVEKDEQFFKNSKYLTVSSQLHLEAYAAELGSVWTLSPTFRAERSDTPRHLAEFYMLEVEVSHAPHIEVLMTLAEDLIKYVVTALQGSIAGQEMLVMKHNDEGGIESVDADTSTDIRSRWDALLQSSRWQRITYSDAMDHLQAVSDSARFQYKPSWTSGLQLEHERYLVDHFGKGGPLFVTDYPKAIKPFYMLPSGSEENAKDSETVANFDLLLPHVAELIGGSLREHRLPNLISNMRQHGLVRTDLPSAETTQKSDEADYPGLEPHESLGSLQWYADLRRYGSTPHGGFGLGFDRLLSYLTGVTNIRDVVGFPRYWGRADC